MAYGDEDLARRTASDKSLIDKHLVLLKILNIMDINADLPQWFTKFLIKNLQVVVLIRMKINLLLTIKN